MNLKTKTQKAFTLIELLVVIAIISILSSILFAAIDPKAQSIRADDAKRIMFMNQLEKALEFYFLDWGYYPQLENVHTWSTGQNKTQFNTLLQDYMPIDITEDYLNADSDFYYSSNAAAGYVTYGMMIRLIDSSNYHLLQNDGGYNPWTYEKGLDPIYCMETHAGDWWTYNVTRCVDGD